MLCKLPARLALLSAPLTLAMLCAPSLRAQMHKVAAPEVVTRAIGVYEYTGTLEKPTAARIVPVSIFINGRLQDAGIYRPQPMPFALETGIVYSLQQSGKPIGTVTLEYATKLLPVGSSPDLALMGTWTGYGVFSPPEKPKPSTLTASVKIPTIDGESSNPDDDRPHFTGRQPGEGNPSAPKTASTKTPAASTTPAPPEDPDRPHLKKHSETAAPATSPDPDANDPDRPTLKHRDLPPDQPESKKKQKKQGDSAVIPMATSLNDDPNRPILKRGKTRGMVTTAKLVGLPPDLHQIVAVSDAVDRDPHLFAREWETHTEHIAVQAKLTSLAQPLIAKYDAENKLTPAALGPMPPKPVLRTSARTRNAARTRKKSSHAAAPQPHVTLDEESVRSFELTYGGMPTFVYTAESPIAVGGPIYVTLIAQRLPSGEMQLAFSSVTDASHLDRTPHMRLVDAVDPDASHRGSLLFELRAQTTREFALYRLITAHAEQQFVTGIMQ